MEQLEIESVSAASNLEFDVKYGKLADVVRLLAPHGWMLSAWEVTKHGWRTYWIRK